MSILRSMEQSFERWIGVGAELSGSGVMALGQFFCGRLGRGVDNREVEMCVSVIGIVGKRLEHFFFGRFLPSFLAGGDAQVIVCGRALRIEASAFVSSVSALSNFACR